MFKTLLSAALLLSATPALAQTQTYPPQQPQPAPSYPPAPQPQQPQPDQSYPPPAQPAPGPYQQQQPQQQPYQPYQFRGPFQHHRGLMFGFGLGLGGTKIADCDDCIGSGRSLAMDFQIGGFLMPQFALMLDVNGYAKTETENSLQSSTTTALVALAGQYWLMPNMWVKAGVGAAGTTLTQDVVYQDAGVVTEEVDLSGFGATFALGYEVFNTGSFALDVSGRLNAITLNKVEGVELETSDKITGASLLIGARWK